jgi:hypothetical protein
MRMKSIGIAILFGAVVAAYGQGVAGPTGWPAVQDGDTTTFKSPSDDVWLSIVDLKQAPHELGAYLRINSPNLQVQQNDRLTVLDGRPLQLMMLEDSQTGGIIIVFARPQDTGLRIAILGSGTYKLAASNLGALTQIASQWQGWPQNLSGSGAPGTHTGTTAPKNGGKHLVYNPTSHIFHLATSTDPAASLSGSYSYTSDLFASPIGKSVLPGAGTATILFTANEFSLTGTPAGSFTQNGASLTLQYPTKQHERFKMAVLDISDGVITKFAIGPCIYVKTDLTGGQGAHL